MACLYKRILFSRKKDWYTDTGMVQHDELENITLRETSQARHKKLHNVWFHLHEMPTIGKCIEIEDKTRDLPRAEEYREMGSSANM